MNLRKYREAEKWYDRALLLQPEDSFSTVYKYRNRLLWKGSAPDLRSSIRTLQRTGLILHHLHRFDLFERRFQEALAHVDSLSELSILAFKPKEFAFAEIYARMGDSTKMEMHAQSAVPVLEQAVQEEPADHRRRASLGLTYAFLGRKEEAIREGKQAVEIFSVAKDAFFGPYFVGDLAWIYALVGEKEAAIEQLDSLLSIPSEFSVPLLRIDPRWDSLRDHPGFEEMLRKYEREES